MMKVLITGIAGFIGFHSALKLAHLKHEVIGIDNFNHYYDPVLKRKRAEILENQGISVEELDICDQEGFKKKLIDFKPTHVLHLAAQAGVRYSLTYPEAYVKANITGFLSVLESLKNTGIKLVYASSSSVYGLNSQLPYSVKDRTDAQASFYGTTKKSNELMAENYHHLYGQQAVGLRYFTVYGPWGRPDMAPILFTKAILEGKPIQLFNFGNMQRDFTYVDDIVDGTIAALEYTGKGKLFNLGNHSPVSLLRFVEILESAIGKKAITELKPLQPGDVLATFADIEESQKELGFNPKVSLEEGLPRFVDWCKEYMKGCAREGT